MRIPNCVLLAALVLVSCKKTPEVDADFAPAAAKVKTTLATLPKIKQAIDGIAPLDGDTLALPGGKKESSTLITVDQLTALGNCFPDAKICNEFWWRLSACEAISKLTPEEATAKFDTVTEAKRCAGLRYLAVARKRSFTKPVVDKPSSTYQGGHLSVELLVFDLQSAAYLGGFIVDAKNPEKLENMNVATDIEAYLQQHLGRVVFDAMRARIDT